MPPSANDWASPDQTKNIILADADAFGNALASALALQFAKLYVLTTQGEIISEAELRGNQFISPLPVNLFCTLAAATSNDQNVATLRSQLRAAAAGSDPIGSLFSLLQLIFPQSDIAAMLSRLPAVQNAITALMQTI